MFVASYQPTDAEIATVHLAHFLSVSEKKKYGFRMIAWF